MHSHKQYPLHTNATDAIKELVAEPSLLHEVIQQLANFLTNPDSDDVILWTTLLVLDNFVGAVDRSKAITNISEMVKVGIPSIVEALAK